MSSFFKEFYEKRFLYIKFEVLYMGQWHDNKFFVELKVLKVGRPPLSLLFVLAMEALIFF